MFDCCGECSATAQRSAIGVAPMTDTANLDNFVRGVNEEEPVIGDPEPQFFHIALQRFEVAHAGLGEACKA
jgi:hypothetical protein